MVRAGERREGAHLVLRMAQLAAAWDPAGRQRVVELVERAWALAPGLPEALEVLERVVSESGDHRGHVEVLERLAVSTRDRGARVALQLELERLHLVRFGDTAAALDALFLALELDPACETAAIQAFEHLADAGRAAEAVSVLERHLAATPEKPQHALWRTRAAALAAANLADLARARRHLESALRSDPRYAPAAVALAPILEQAGEWQRLVEVIEMGLQAEKDPAARVARLRRIAGLQAERLERPREALRTLSRALAIDPRSAETRDAMLRVAAAGGANTELLRALRAAVESLDGDARARAPLLRLAAEILDRDLDHADEAVKAWGEVTANDPSDTQAAASLTAAMARAGRHAEAVRALEGEIAPGFRRRAAGPHRPARAAPHGRRRGRGPQPSSGARCSRCAQTTTRRSAGSRTRSSTCRATAPPRSG